MIGLSGVLFAATSVTPSAAPPAERRVEISFKSHDGMDMLYRDTVTAMNVGFFSYEGRGIRMGTEPPRFEQIDRAAFNTGTLDSKVRDALSAIAAVRQHAGLERVRIMLMGASVLQNWATTSAVVAVPDGWFKDHFAHQPIWSFLSKLDIPVGCFQGMADAMVAPNAVKALESRARSAGKSKMEFRYFAGLDHSLNIQDYFLHAEMPAGHQAIFEFIQRVASAK